MIIFTQKTSPTAELPLLTATLDIHSRMKSRARFHLDNGEEAGIVLTRGEILRNGDILTDDTRQYYVKIKAKAETVSTAYCQDPLLMAKVCFHLGNRHVPLQIEKDFIRYQHDHVLDALLKQMGVTVTTESAPFEPESGAYHSLEQGHHHHHEHE